MCLCVLACECTRVCSKVLMGACVCITWPGARVEVRGQVFQLRLSSTSRLSPISTAVLCAPGWWTCELPGDAPVSPSHPPGSVLGFRMGITDLTVSKVELRVLLSTLVISQFEKHCKYLWRRVQALGACLIKSQGRKHNPELTCGLWFKGQWASPLEIY